MGSATLQQRLTEVQGAQALPRGRRRTSRRSGRVARTAKIAGLVVVLLAATACKKFWVVEANPSPVRAIHVALLHTGKVLLVAGSGNDSAAFAAGTFKTTVWDPATNTFHDVATPWDAFCSGHAFLANGRLLVAGGTSAFPSSGSASTYSFDPDAEQYLPEPQMSLGRWYPTVTELGDGNLFAVGGFAANGARTSDSEVFDGSNWVQQRPIPTGLNFMPLYPALHLLRDGRLFYSGVNVFGGGTAEPGFWDLGTNTFSPVPGLTDSDRRDQGMSLLLPPEQMQKVMVIGGGSHKDTSKAPVASTAIIDVSQPNPAYVPGPPISRAKMYVSAVILPDSTVLETGGGSTSVAAGNNPVLTAEIYNPQTNAWTTAEGPAVGRVYHSSALLLPDGRVATFGGNPVGGFEMRIETFSPPYLFTHTPRPAITQAPTEVHYGESYVVSTTESSPLRSVALVRPGAVTHSGDSNQRLVDVAFVPTEDGSGVTVTVPSSSNDAPPGWYMLFVVDGNGVPSVAAWVHLA